MAAASSPRQRRRRPWKADFPYPVDYNDHFETPLRAYQDIQHLLHWIDPESKDWTLYDPYYCNGQTSRLLQQLGYNNVVHEKRDFYADMEAQLLPDYHVLVTNPPYSDQHKRRCLDFAMKQLLEHDKIFFILLPAYVAGREYYRNLLDQHRAHEAIAYLIPPLDYAYHHPQGTGHDTSPFGSLWFCGIGRERCRRLRLEWNNESTMTARPKVALAMAELQAHGVVAGDKRPNPRQRHKRRRKLQQQAALTVEKSVEQEEKKGDAAVPNKRSKYRDETGNRIRKRF